MVGCVYECEFYYAFHQISEILIFCIGNPILNLMDFDDFDEFSSFFSREILYREFNSKFSKIMMNLKLFGKSRFLIDKIEFFFRFFSYAPENVFFAEKFNWRTRIMNTADRAHEKLRNST